MRIRESVINLFGVLLGVFMIVSFLIENEVMIIISVAIPAVLLLIAASPILYLMASHILDNLSTIKSWSYSYDTKHNGYSIQAKRTLFGFNWSTNEYLSTTEEEAKLLVERKNWK